MTPSEQTLLGQMIQSFAKHHGYRRMHNRSDRDTVADSVYLWHHIGNAVATLMDWPEHKHPSIRVINDQGDLVYCAEDAPEKFWVEFKHDADLGDFTGSAMDFMQQCLIWVKHFSGGADLPHEEIQRRVHERLPADWTM